MHNMEEDIREEGMMVVGRVFLMKGRKDCGENPGGSANMLPASLLLSQLASWWATFQPSDSGFDRRKFSVVNIEQV